jgi:hypothetical protein
MEQVSEHLGERSAARRRRQAAPAPGWSPTEPGLGWAASPESSGSRSLAAALLRPVLTVAALPVVYVASAAYWLVAAGIIERRLAPSTVRAQRN